MGNGLNANIKSEGSRRVCRPPSFEKKWFGNPHMGGECPVFLGPRSGAAVIKNLRGLRRANNGPVERQGIAPNEEEAQGLTGREGKVFSQERRRGSLFGPKVGKIRARPARNRSQIRLFTRNRCLFGGGPLRHASKGKFYRVKEKAISSANPIKGPLARALLDPGQSSPRSRTCHGMN